jgi:uncharacterized protein (TIGR00730 family)
MQKAICVFSSSSDVISSLYFDAAIELGYLIAKRDYILVNGGADVGLMGALAQSVQKNGGKVIGVIPKLIYDKGIAYESADELIVTKDMRERKALMEEKADIFIALPGGFGTLEEILEILTFKQLRLHDKPIIFLNTNGFYNHLINHFEKLYNEKISKPDYRKLYCVAPNVKSIFSYIDEYTPIQFQDKWH